MAPPPGPYQKPNNTPGLLGMIFGIVGLVLAVCCAVLGVISGGAGVVLGAVGMKAASDGRATNRGMALTGVICGSIAVVLAIGNVILSLVLNYGGFYNDFN